MRNIDLLWQKFEENFKIAEKECIPTKQVRSGKIKCSHEFKTEHLQGNGREKFLMETISRNKGSKVYHHYYRV